MSYKPTKQEIDLTNEQEIKEYIDFCIELGELHDKEKMIWRPLDTVTGKLNFKVRLLA